MVAPATTPAAVPWFRATALDVMMRALRRLCRDARYPATARHIECSLLLSTDAGPAVPMSLLQVALEAVNAAHRISLHHLVERMDPSFPAPYPDIWPGEHYRLLAGLVEACAPRLVVEIGTGEGLSALAMKSHLPAAGRIVTFDVVDWRHVSRTCLRAEDFADDRLRQEVADLADDALFARHRELLRRADIIFFDGPKDGRFEPLLLRRFDALDFDDPPLVVYDDIRLWNMLAVWQAIRRPKLDLTSFGHWCGTGLVQWT